MEGHIPLDDETVGVFYNLRSQVSGALPFPSPVTPIPEARCVSMGWKTACSLGRGQAGVIEALVLCETQLSEIVERQAVRRDGSLGAVLAREGAKMAVLSRCSLYETAEVIVPYPEPHTPVSKPDVLRDFPPSTSVSTFRRGVSLKGMGRSEGILSKRPPPVLASLSPVV